MDAVPLGTYLRQEEHEQRRIIEAALLFAVHGALASLGRFLLGISLVAEVAAKAVMNTARRGVFLSIERLFSRAVHHAIVSCVVRHERFSRHALQRMVDEKDPAAEKMAAAMLVRRREIDRRNSVAGASWSLPLHMPLPFEILLQADHNILVRTGAAIVQVRNGPLTFGVMERMEQQLRLWRARQSGPIVFIIILEAGAPPATGPLRERQREAIQSMMSGDRTYIATALLGSGVILSLQRTIARGLAKTSPRINVTGSVQDAVRWVVKTVPGGFEETRLREVAEEARALLRDRDPPVPLSTRALIE